MLQVKEGEIFSFNSLVYDVAGLKRLINAQPALYGPHTTAIDDALLHHLSLYSTPDEARIASLTPAELDVPCIAVRLPDRSTRFVDGFHRIMRRSREGLTTVDIFLVPTLKVRGFIRRVQNS